MKRIGGRRGERLRRWASKANSFLKKTKLLSRVGKLYGMTPLPASGLVSKAARLAGTMGYGRRKTRVRRVRY